VAFHFELRLVGLLTMLRQRLGARWPAFRWFPVWPCRQGQPVKSVVRTMRGAAVSPPGRVTHFVFGVLPGWLAWFGVPQCLRSGSYPEAAWSTT